GKYGQTVEKGIRWVLGRQQPNGLIATEYGHEMYHHGIATLMLAEVAGMTDGELGREVRKKLEKAVALILKAQRRTGAERGGWRYQVAPVNGSDMSVTGWQLMALRAAKHLGGDVPTRQQLLERLPPAPARNPAAQPAGQWLLGRLRPELRPRLPHRDGGPGPDRRVPLPADLPARRRAGREGPLKSAPSANSPF